MTTDHTDEIRAIEALIARQFGSLCWKPGAPADWKGFSADFVPGASRFPSARPAKPQSVVAFVDRMSDLAEGTLQTFHEDVLGIRVQVFGNVAVAVAAVENTENGTETNRERNRGQSGFRRPRFARGLAGPNPKRFSSPALICSSRFRGAGRSRSEPLQFAQ